MRVHVAKRVVPPLLLLLLAMLAAVGTLAFADRKKDKDKKGDTKQGSEGGPVLTLLGPGEPVTGGPREPSGIAFHPRLGHLFAVGDEGTLVELDPSGRVLRTHTFAADLEDVAVHSPTGTLLLLAEMSEELIAFDPVSWKETHRFRLDAAGLLGEKPGDAIHGFEGLAFRDEPGGGRFYLLHQRRPAMMVVLSFDPSRPTGPLGGGVVTERWKLEGHAGVTAATYVPSLDRVLVIAEPQDRLLALDENGRVRAEVALPGVQQEGLCFDSKGTLWIADDKAGRLVRFPGALAALTIGLKPGPPAKRP